MSTTGWSSDYYELPEGATELQDLIDHKDMNFARGCIFKAAYRFGEKEGTSKLYDLDKIIWFATRERAKILKSQTGEKIEHSDHHIGGEPGRSTGSATRVGAPAEYAVTGCPCPHCEGVRSRRAGGDASGDISRDFPFFNTIRPQAD